MYERFNFITRISMHLRQFRGGGGVGEEGGEGGEGVQICLINAAVPYTFQSNDDWSWDKNTKDKANWMNVKPHDC